MLTSEDFAKKKSHPVKNGLSDAEVHRFLAVLEGWKLQDGKIEKTYNFKNYYETMAFVNALAYIIHGEDHHPELVVSYNSCVVKFNTHSVNEGKGGISENDFICAAKIDGLLFADPKPI